MGLHLAKAPHKASVGYRSVSTDRLEMGNLNVAANTAGKDTKWMNGSPLKGALLALLLELEEPAHPYMLATLLAERLGSAFLVEPEAVYKMLKALEDAELVASEERENETGSWRRQNIYRPTDLTGRAVSAWMSAPVSDVAARPELLVKIAFARPSDIPVLLDALNALEMRRMDRLDECQSAEVPMSSWVDLATNIACTWTKEHVQADLHWIMATRDWIREYAAKHEVFRR